MEIESTTEEDRKAITEDMITVADKIALADLQNKNFLTNWERRFCGEYWELQR